MSDTSTALHFWDRQVQSSQDSWMAHPLVREYINSSIAGDGRSLWPMEWFEEWLSGRRFHRLLSIGCGTGALERDLIRRNLCDRIDAFDGSLASLAIAAQEAEREGMSGRIHYFASDFNRPSFPRKRFDAVFIHQALHHVGKIEKLLRHVLLALKPDGIFYLDEYIGPSRSDWNDERLAVQRAHFATIPASMRSVAELGFPVVPEDPSEAIRSGEIMPQLDIGFEVVDFRGYGGNLLAPIYALVDWTEGPQELQRLIDGEKAILADGQRPFHAVIVARPKQGLAKLAASWRYFTEPKWKRVVYEVKQRLG